MFDPSLKMRKKFPLILIFFRSSRHRKIPATTGADSLKSDQTGTTQPTWSPCVTDMSVASRGRSVTIDTSPNEQNSPEVSSHLFYVMFLDIVKKKILLKQERLSQQWFSFECKIENASSITAMILSRSATLHILGVPEHTVVRGQPVALFSVNASDMKAFCQLGLERVRWFSAKDIKNKKTRRQVDNLCLIIMKNVYKMSRMNMDKKSNNLTIVLKSKDTEQTTTIADSSTHGLGTGSGVLVALATLEEPLARATHDKKVPIRHVALGSSGAKIISTRHAAIRSMERGITLDRIKTIVNTSMPTEDETSDVLRYLYRGTTVIAEENERGEKVIITVYGKNDAVPNPKASNLLLPGRGRLTNDHKKHRYRIKYMKETPRTKKKRIRGTDESV